MISPALLQKVLILTILCGPGFLRAQSGSIPSFPFHPNDLSLTRLAQPSQYFDKIGPEAGVMGFESGEFEAWMWPWKPLRGFELQFLLGASTQPILAKDIVRTITVTPEVTTLTFTYEAFTVKEHILIPRDEPGALILLEVSTTTPLSIIPGFIPVMQPMWPCGVGGQFSYWDDSVNGFVISEAQWRSIFLCGSPAGKQMAAPPAHMFADNPLQFRIDVSPGEVDDRFIPIVICGARPDTSGKTRFDSVKAVYTRLTTNAREYYEKSYQHFRSLRTGSMRLTTPDAEMNLAYEWSKVALDNLMVRNPRLGYGMVAGYGLSGGGARPGFAWFFGGDAFINVLALNSMGMFTHSRDALAFTQKWQRQEIVPIRKKHPTDPPTDVGKMSHELSQSDGLCDWWNDYRYGYNHADTSPWYIVAMGDYVRSSGDTAFLRQSWKSVKQAYEWCLSKDSDGDGLMDLKGAGLGALEFGKLVGIYADVYTCGVFVRAVSEMEYMAGLLGDAPQALQAREQFAKARPQMEKKFWLEKEGFYAYGATEEGKQVREKTPWSGVAMMFELLDARRSSMSFEQLNSSDLCTDWGVRTLSNTSTLFEPTNYNYGAVWPFIASFFNTAQFKHGYPLPAYQILRSNVRHAFDNALGMLPEVFSGTLNQKLGEGYHHQGFSTTGYLLPMVRGLLGIEVDALAKRIFLEPFVPADWDTVRMENIRVGVAAYDLMLTRTDSSILVTTSSQGTDAVEISFQPVLPPGANATVSVFNSGRGETRQRHVSGDSTHVIRNGDNIRLEFSPMPSLIPPRENVLPGQRNSMVKIISCRPDESGRSRVRLLVEGKGGMEYELPISRAGDISAVSGAVLRNGSLVIAFPRSDLGEFVRKEIFFSFSSATGR